MEAMNIEQATTEINGWLDAKKVKQKKRDSYKDAIENLVDAVCDGSLTIEDGKLVHKLSFPVMNQAGGVAFDSLEYKQRLTLEEKSNCAKNLKPGDAEGRILATAQALTGKAMGLLTKLDTEDATILQSIVVFFL